VQADDREHLRVRDFDEGHGRCSVASDARIDTVVVWAAVRLPLTFDDEVDP
jgi:hypothetical protein